MTTYVAMLRGVNVSGRNRLAMDDLRALVEACGGQRVRTYVQSGNAVFDSARSASRVAAALGSSLREAVGNPVAVLLRGVTEMESVMASNPFLRRGADERLLHVTFLAAAPSPAAVSATVPEATAGDDEFVVVGREVHVRCPHGYGRTKLSNAFFEKRFGTEATTRNWRTVAALVDLAHG